MNLSGEWAGIASVRGGPEGPVSMSVLLVLSQDADRVTGTAESNHKTYEITHGTVDGDKLAFAIVSGDEQTQFDLTVQRDRIQGHATTHRRGGVTLNGGLSLNRVTEE
jgi:hypothetical protein